MTSSGAGDAVGRGATIAVQQCSMCHGAQGMSDGNSPNLAGQYPEVVIKQLYDYKRGDRSSAFMQTIAQTLTDRDIQDIAAYYDSLPKARAAPVQADDPGAPALVRVGDPLRNIVPCVACHGGIDHKIGAPWLEGMPKEYLTNRDEDFASVRGAMTATADAQHGASAHAEGARERRGILLRGGSLRSPSLPNAHRLRGPRRRRQGRHHQAITERVSPRCFASLRYRADRAEKFQMYVQRYLPYLPADERS